jgi:hypothetical protein
MQRKSAEYAYVGHQRPLPRPGYDGRGHAANSRLSNRERACGRFDEAHLHRACWYGAWRSCRGLSAVSCFI